jgi:hypothetical protein
MGLLHLLKARHESRSLDRSMKKLLERMESKPCSSDEEFNKYLSNLQSSIQTAKKFNRTNFPLLTSYRIPVQYYEERLNRAKESGACYESLDG